MKILKILIVLFSLLAYLNADDHNHKHKNTHIYKNLEYLDLNTQQYEKIKKVLIEYKHEYYKYYKEKKKKQKKLQKLIRKNDFDVEKYEDISEDIFKEAIELEAHTLEKLHKILNPAQREKFSHYLKEWQVE